MNESRVVSDTALEIRGITLVGRIPGKVKAGGNMVLTHLKKAPNPTSQLFCL